MKLYILDAERANVFQPKDQAAAIRIYSGISSANVSYAPQLVGSYLAEFKYVFDDVSQRDFAELHRYPTYKGIVLFTPEIADKILSDFRSVKDSIECLMVSCRYGQGRSAAVAIALNDIFRLGHDSEQLFGDYPDANRFVYRLLLERSW